MSKRPHTDVPTFPDSTGWSPKDGSVRGQVSNPSNPRVGQYYWKIQNGPDLAYFEYEDPTVRKETRRAFFSSRRSPAPAPAPAPAAKVEKTEDVGHGKSYDEKFEEVIALLKGITVTLNRQDARQKKIQEALAVVGLEISSSVGEEEDESS